MSVYERVLPETFVCVGVGVGGGIEMCQSVCLCRAGLMECFGVYTRECVDV